MDSDATLVIHCMLDDLFVRLMQKLSIPVPTFKLERWVEIELEESKSGKETLYVSGITESRNPYDLFRFISINEQVGYSYALQEE